MQYTFGTIEVGNQLKEIVKTVSTDWHTDLTGTQTFRKEYSDCDVIDTFTIESKFKSSEDVEKKFYDWYFITNHSTQTDREKGIEKSNSVNEYIAYYSGVELEDTDPDRPTMTFDKVKNYYDRKFWSKRMVRGCVEKGAITQEQYKEITGDDYPVSVSV